MAEYAKVVGLPDRFWSKVDKSGDCWIWISTKNRYGYGQFTVKAGKIVSAHRLAWELLNGPIPAGLQVLHNCRNRCCVRHTRLGTNKENQQDKILDGTSLKGELNPSSKLSATQVAEIRSKFTGAWGEQTSLAHEYGVSISTIHFIVRKKRWTGEPNG